MAESAELQESVHVESIGKQSPDALSSPAEKAKKLIPNRPKRVRPNAFVSLPITNSEVKEKMAGIQQQMVDSDNSIESLRIDPCKFHLTLMVLHLDEESQLSVAQAALDESVAAIKPLLSAVVFEFDKVSSFGQDVVFMSMSDEGTVAAYKKSAEKVRGIFASHGLRTADDREPTPHVTLFKVDGRGKRSSKIPRSTYDSIEDTNCGGETFNALQLCSMTKPKQASGYYHVVYEKGLSVPIPSQDSDGADG